MRLMSWDGLQASNKVIVMDKKKRKLVREIEHIMAHDKYVGLDEAMKKELPVQKLKVDRFRIRHKGTSEASLLFCDKVEYGGNHLMFYEKGRLVFKVWLKKEPKTIEQALKDVGIEFIR